MTAVLLYDGECGFCSRGVLFTFHRDPHARVRFARLQSDVGRDLLAQHGIVRDMTTLVLVDELGAHVRSTAVLRTARLLRWPWSWAYGAIVIPRGARDALYGWIANRRHRFGPSTAKRGADGSADASGAVERCANPSSELRARMLDAALPAKEA